MKELTIEEKAKAKAYDKAIERAKEMCTTLSDKAISEYIFPELKELEDEKIRKWLIGYFNQYIIDGMPQVFGNGLNVKDVLAWLERQGNDKIEQKFKIGDWVVFNNKHQSIYQVEKIEDGYYILRHTHGGTFRVCVLHDESLKPWTIQDAKDGDVVVDKSDGTIGIFQSIGHHPDGGSFNDSSYCFLHCRYDDGFFYADFENGNTMDSDDAIPATKEQRDILFKAMADAGYTFDFEKKELNKIEQKLAWSEDDERVIDDAVYYLEHYNSSKTERFEKLYVSVVIDKLKSIKDKVIKQEWSEEDENNILFLTSIIEECFKDKEKITLYGDTVCANFTKEDVIDRLKSLKPKKQWKPSEEQMKALNYVVNLMASSESLKENDYYYNVFKDLRKQLKAL